jgi:hypothetical protein
MPLHGMVLSNVEKKGKDDVSQHTPYQLYGNWSQPCKGHSIAAMHAKWLCRHGGKFLYISCLGGMQMSQPFNMRYLYFSLHLEWLHLSQIFAPLRLLQEAQSAPVLQQPMLQPQARGLNPLSLLAPAMTPSCSNLC